MLVRTTNQVQYRAPEVFDRHYSKFVDAWALGAVLYKTMSGYDAYQGTCKPCLLLDVHLLLLLIVMLLAQCQ